LKKEKIQNKKNKKFRKLIVEEEMEIPRMVEEKLEKEENLIEIRTVEEIVPKRFHKYLKVFEKKESERMLIRKTWNYTINLKEVFVLKKGVFERSVEKEIYLTIKVTTNIISILCS